jgi:hypothetical protein
MGTTSDDLVVRVVCNLVAGGSGGSVLMGQDRRLVHVVWTDVERPRDRRKRWSDAGRRHATLATSRKSDVARRDTQNAARVLSGPSSAGIV